MENLEILQQLLNGNHLNDEERDRARQLLNNMEAELRSRLTAEELEFKLFQESKKIIPAPMFDYWDLTEWGDAETARQHGVEEVYLYCYQQGGNRPFFLHLFKFGQTQPLEKPAKYGVMIDRSDYRTSNLEDLEERLWEFKQKEYPTM